MLLFWFSNLDLKKKNGRKNPNSFRGAPEHESLKKKMKKKSY